MKANEEPEPATAAKPDTEGDILAADYSGLDLSTLDFDVMRHREGMAAMARLHLDVDSVIPALRARDFVFVRFPSGKFSIEVGAPGEPEPVPSSMTPELIYRASTGAQAQKVRFDVERYFLRHFPGRTIAEAQAPAVGETRLDDAEAGHGEDCDYGVYVVCSPSY